MSTTLVRCSMPDCAEPAAYKIAATWGDGRFTELKTYGHACADHLGTVFRAAGERRGALAAEGRRGAVGVRLAPHAAPGRARVGGVAAEPRAARGIPRTSATSRQRGLLARRE